RLVDFIQGREEWTGTATELLDALGETETAANVLTKWMNEYRLGFLLENHIRYDFSRRSSGRMISLARQEGTDGDGRDDCDGVSGIPPAAVT
ncbi:ATPase, partial [Klebsiella oxytoca]